MKKKEFFSSFFIVMLLLLLQRHLNIPGATPFTPKRVSTRTRTSTSTSTGVRTRLLLRAFGDDSNGNTSGGERKHLVLIGGGHAHLQVIKAFNKKSRPSNVDVTLIDAQSFASYSGMAPGAIGKQYLPKETQIDLVGLCFWADVKFIEDKVISIDPTSQQISLTGRSSTKSCVHYDLLSIDIGSTSRGVISTPGVKEFAIPTRPISRLISRVEQEEAQIIKQLESSQCNGGKVQVTVVGGGVAGIELALSMRGRWSELLRNNCFEVTLLNSGKGLLLEESVPCCDALQRILKERKIKVRHDCKVERINKDVIELANGENISYTHCIWATGAEAHSLAYELQQNGIDINENGWIEVSPTLQSLSHKNIFAAGDCASIVSSDYQPPPKAGTYRIYFSIL